MATSDRWPSHGVVCLGYHVVGNERELINAGFNPDIYGAWNTGGNNLANQLIMDGMKLQPCSPGFVDGRNAILAADQALTGGANQCIIWKAFAKRGLGTARQALPQHHRRHAHLSAATAVEVYWAKLLSRAMLNILCWSVHFPPPITCLQQSAPLHLLHAESVTPPTNALAAVSCRPQRQPGLIR
jgi:hypothetical protein